MRQVSWHRYSKMNLAWGLHHFSCHIWDQLCFSTRLEFGHISYCISFFTERRDGELSWGRVMYVFCRAPGLHSVSWSLVRHAHSVHLGFVSWAHRTGKKALHFRLSVQLSVKVLVPPLRVASHLLSSGWTLEENSSARQVLGFRHGHADRIASHLPTQILGKKGILGLASFLDHQLFYFLSFSC